MEFIVLIIILAIIFYLLSVAWPFLLLLVAIWILWKVYELYYYKSSSFAEIKQRVTTYINDCNELNQHIESLKDTTLISNKTDYGEASYQDASSWNYKRKHLKEEKYAPNVHQCSRTVCSNAQKKPFEYICKYFGIKATEETLSKFEAILNNFEAAEEVSNTCRQKKKK